MGIVCAESEGKRNRSVNNKNDSSYENGRNSTQNFYNDKMNFISKEKNNYIEKNNDTKNSIKDENNNNYNDINNYSTNTNNYVKNNNYNGNNDTNNYNNDNNNQKKNNICQRALDIHNRFRENHYCKKLKLNDELSEKAQKYADKCAQSDNIIHYIDLYNDEVIGQNIYIVDKNKFDVDKICHVWYDEKKKYDFNSNNYNKNASHFTQLVWKSTECVGFGYSNNNEGKVYFVAYYYPAGNIFNEFGTNVLKK